ncbi:MAG: type II toxin-antitoxin system VapC family toxin [Deltaproteobacteria bacterium]|nr:type II toxin-antitoxin system VapC family toxin [Deltaproteobacteria bacterium]
MHKVLLDTNVFIDWLRLGRHPDWVIGSAMGAVRFLSSVVLMELRLGADTLRRRRAVDRIRDSFPNGRWLAPGPAAFDRAAAVFRALHGDGSSMRDRLAAMDDILIALTAREIGATLVTSNTGDFGRIAAELPGLRVLEP